ncbi:MAG: site-specific DNA-methyltransferase [Ferruginibacter sp.]|nr:site-specific DNA-methyltransferase [Ferruginibacter sp.]
MSIGRIKPSFHFETERIEQLKQIAPEAFADGKINWESLQEALGIYLEEEDITSEHFGLFWPGKRAARKIASLPSEGTLVPCMDEAVDQENTQNIFIEGENLEVLKLLQKSYANRIKLIFIDPPYNTGKDFIYEDDFTETIDEYLRRTGQLDEEAKPISANTKADGRFHSKWLSMMYPRLRLARNLLKDEGYIFISIDDNEVHNLRELMNEVFGEENFKGCVIWQHSLQPKGYLGKFSIHHNYLLCYTKSSEILIGNLQRTDEHNKNYSNPDNDPNGPWRTGDVRNSLYRKNLIYDIKTPSGKKISPPPNGWRWSKETLQEKISSGEIVFSNDETRIIRKIYLNNLEGRTPESIWFGKDCGTTRDGIQELKDLFNDKPPFDTPKPTTLIQKILELTTDAKNEDIVLDFFAGSGTTAHAVLKSNFEDQGNRRFLMIQMEEPIDLSLPSGINAKSLKLKTISQISKERIKRAGKLLSSEYKKKNKDNETAYKFKSYKLSHSNFKPWKNYTGNSIKELEIQFEKSTTPLVEDWESQNLLTEVLLIEGFPLDSKIEVLNQYKKNEVTMVTSDFCEHKLLVCLDKKVYADTIKYLQLNADDIFICLDSAISDQDKITLQDKGLIKTI